jgi:hypothetical protein
MLQCGKVFHEHLTPEKVDQLIEDYRAKYAQLKNQN